jgi:hypothetical protein
MLSSLPESPSGVLAAAANLRAPIRIELRQILANGTQLLDVIERMCCRLARLLALGALMTRVIEIKRALKHGPPPHLDYLAVVIFLRFRAADVLDLNLAVLSGVDIGLEDKPNKSFEMLIRPPGNRFVILRRSREAEAVGVRSNERNVPARPHGF